MTRWIKTPRNIYAGGEVIKANEPSEVPELIAENLINQALAVEVEPPKKEKAKKEKPVSETDPPADTPAYDPAASDGVLGGEGV